MLEKLPFFILALAFGWIAYVSQGSSGLLTVIAGPQTWQAVLIMCHNAMFYLGKSIVPNRLCPQYPLPPDVDITFSNPHFAIGLISAALFAAFVRGSLPW